MAAHDGCGECWLANLILFCHRHHTEVDSIDNATDYPEAVLLAWKEEQVRRANGRGPVLTDEVMEVVEHFTDASTVVNAANLSLGGAGGVAPGASGGGGGAIGSGVVGVQ